MHKLRVYTLGSLQVFLDGAPVKNFDTDKMRALLAYLAVEGDRPQRREVLAGLLWSDQPDERAFHSLRQALSGLRKALGEKAAGASQPSPASFLIATRETIQLNPEMGIWLDLAAFEASLEGAFRHYRRGIPGGRLNIRLLKQAVELYRGPFLDHLYLKGSPLFEEWAMLKREHANQQMIEALSYLGDTYERSGAYGLARENAQKLARLAPWEEAACRRAVQLLAGEGHWTAALAQAQTYLQYLREELNVEPSPEMLSLVASVQQRALQLTPVTRPAALPHNLPAPDTPFVGRHGELDLLANLLADPGYRLISLTGMGGIGKTRLALEAAAEQAGLFRGGVYFAPLTGASNLAEMISALAAAARFQFFGDRPPVEQIVRYFTAKDALLVLDNFEQLLPAARGDDSPIRLILDLLKSSALLKILVTSRAPLQLRQERVVEVAGLAYPPEGAGQPDQRYSAIELFEQTARHMQPQFSITADRPAIAQICRLLEGVPLAIELSAAWVPAKTSARILTEIQDGLDHLATSMQDVAPRHRSMRAVFEHSWHLLSAAEQAVFKRLANFRGGFGLPAAARVAGAPAELLASLAQKSLLKRSEADRYAWHGLVRRFAAEMLAADEGAAWESAGRFAAYYAHFLAAQAAVLKSAGQQGALATMTLELENWRPAWEWLAEQGKAAELCAGSEAIFHYYNIRAGFEEGITLLQQAATRLETDPVQALALGKILSYLGALAYRARVDELSQAALEQAHLILEDQADADGLAFCLVFQSGLLSRIKEHAAALEAAERGLALFQQAGNRWGEGYALYSLGLLYNRKGMMAEAEAALVASLKAARQCGDLHRQIGPLNLLGDGACQVGAYDLAQEYFEECLAISREIQDRYNEALTALNLGTVYHLRRQLSEARPYYETSLEICRDIGDIAGQAMALSNLGELLSDGGQYREALSHFEQGLALSRAQNDEWSEVSCLNNLANACIALEDLPAAEAHIKTALRLIAPMESPPMGAITLLHLARLRARSGDQAGAAELLQAVLQVEGLEEDIRQKALQEGNSWGISWLETGARPYAEVLAELLSRDRLV